MMDAREIILVADDIRSCHNIGSLMRTAEGLGIEKVYLCGTSPYPEKTEDTRPPHIRQKMSRQISKTALGAESLVSWEFEPDIGAVFAELRSIGYTLAALEQTDDAIPLAEFSPGPKTAIIVGNEIKGVSPEALSSVDVKLKIPMYGKKESFNVAAAAAMALYHVRSYGILDKLKH